MMDILNQNHLSFCIAAYCGIVATTPFHSTRLSALISARKIEQAQKPTVSRKAQKISRRGGGGGRAVLSGLIFLSL